MRATTVEPVSGQLKTCQKLTTMSRRGLIASESEWLLACAAHNLRSKVPDLLPTRLYATGWVMHHHPRPASARTCR